MDLILPSFTRRPSFKRATVIESLSINVSRSETQEVASPPTFVTGTHSFSSSLFAPRLPLPLPLPLSPPRPRPNPPRPLAAPAPAGPASAIAGCWFLVYDGLHFIAFSTEKPAEGREEGILRNCDGTSLGTSDKLEYAMIHHRNVIVYLATPQLLPVSWPFCHLHSFSLPLNSRNFCPSL